MNILITDEKIPGVLRGCTDQELSLLQETMNSAQANRLKTI